MGPIQGVLTRRPACGSQESEGSSSYAKKTLTLTVLESADVSGRNPTEVGTLVLNLAEFASTEGRTDELRKVVKASGAITTVVGDPFLAFSIRCTAVHKALPSAAGDSLLGALPLAFGSGVGAELRRPLGIAVVGGLIVSQFLTLYTTPVVYLALERLARGKRKKIVTAPVAAE